MAKAAPLHAHIRDRLGRRATRACRREGLLPGIVYGHEKENLAVAFSRQDFAGLVQHRAQLLELQLGKKKSETVLIKDIQYNYLGTDPVHVDLIRVDLSERVSISVPIVLRGTPTGVDQGGLLQQVTMELEIECLVTEIPEELRVRVNDLNVGDMLHAADIELAEGATLLTNPEAVVATISAKIEEEEAGEEPAVAAETGEPELIGKTKEEQARTEGTES